MGRQWVDGYSADVEICLVLDDGRRFDVAQIGNGQIFLRQPAELPQTLAVVVIKVDGQAREIDVVLYQGADAKDSYVPYVKRSFYPPIDHASQPQPIA